MIAAAAPAYQVYARHLLASADFAALELDEAGALFKLLNYCWCEGDVSADPARVARVLRCKTQKAQALIPVLLDIRLGASEDGLPVLAFEEADGRIVSPYLELYRADNDAFRASRSRAGKRSAEVRRQKSSIDAEASSTSVQHVLNPVSVSVSGTDKTPQPPNPGVGDNSGRDQAPPGGGGGGSTDRERTLADDAVWTLKDQRMAPLAARAHLMEQAEQRVASGQAKGGLQGAIRYVVTAWFGDGQPSAAPTNAAAPKLEPLADDFEREVRQHMDARATDERARANLKAERTGLRRRLSANAWWKTLSPGQRKQHEAHAVLVWYARTVMGQTPRFAKERPP